MSKLRIKKHVYLDFLGKEYKEAFITFNTIPISQLQSVGERIENAEDSNAETLKILKENYVDSMFPTEDGKLEPFDSADELDELGIDGLIKCYGTLIGRDLAGFMEERLELALKGASEEAIANVTADVDPKSDTPSKRT